MKTVLDRPGEAKHGRSKTIARGEARCDVCKKTKMCLGFDSSEAEYGPVFACQDCVTKLFA